MAKIVANCFSIEQDDLKIRMGAEFPFITARKIYVWLLVKVYGYKYWYIARLTNVNVGNVTHYKNQIDACIKNNDGYVLQKLKAISEHL
jgi:hypothetical protein